MSIEEGEQFIEKWMPTTWDEAEFMDADLDTLLEKAFEQGYIAYRKNIAENSRPYDNIAKESMKVCWQSLNKEQ